LIVGSVNFEKGIFIYQLNESKIVRNYWANMSQVCCLSHLASAPRREVARRAGFDFGYGCIFQPVNISGKLAEGGKGQHRKQIGTWH